MNATRVIDGDGHLHEDPSAIAALLPPDYQRMVAYQVGTRGLFPSLDNLHTVFRINPPLLEGPAPNAACADSEEIDVRTPA